jgi:hypothetical protein
MNATAMQKNAESLRITRYQINHRLDSSSFGGKVENTIVAQELAIYGCQYDIALGLYAATHLHSLVPAQHRVLFDANTVATRPLSHYLGTADVVEFLTHADILKVNHFLWSGYHHRS